MFADYAELSLHLLKVDQCHLLFVLDVPLDLFNWNYLEVDAKHLKLLVRQDLIKEEVARVVWVKLDLETVGVGVVQGTVKQLYQHG